MINLKVTIRSRFVKHLAIDTATIEVPLYNYNELGQYRLHYKVGEDAKKLLKPLADKMVADRENEVLFLTVHNADRMTNDAELLYYAWDDAFDNGVDSLAEWTSAQLTIGLNFGQWL